MKRRVPPLCFLAVIILCLAPCWQGVGAVKLKFKLEECMTYNFLQYEYFYGSFVALPDAYGHTAQYNLKVTSPSGSILHNEHAVSDATFHLVPTEEGPHRFCLKLHHDRSNTRFMATREVLWNINIGLQEQHGKVYESDTQYLWHHVYQMDAHVKELQSGLHFLYWREQRHRMTVESTKRRVLLFALLRAGMLVAVSVGQVLFVRRLFAK